MLDRRRLGILIALPGLVVIGGCTYFRQMIGWVAEKPEIKLVQVEVQSFSVHRIELVFVLDIVNPNAFRVDIEKLDYRVRGLDMELGKGQHTDQIVLEAKEHSTARLPFSVDPDVALNLMKKYLKNPRDLKLKLMASLHLGTAFGSMDMQFEDEKTLIKGLNVQ
ncbi:MAG: LEA type 2 family protein [Pseudobdellovibrionaceae bacterium]|nr:LEA type 2 family protein [Pseudobdellovibrionaceae bacterium]